MKDFNGNQIGLDFNAPRSPLNLRGDGGVTGGELTNEEMMILEILKDHRGKENAILGPVIEAITKIEYDRVRQVISHLVNKHGYLIASYSKGYFIPVTAGEVATATRSLRHRGISILVRAARLQRISLVEIFKQTLLEFKEGGAA